MTKVCIVAALLLAVAGGTFVDFLTTFQSHSSYQRLSDEEKLLFGELVVAAENDELTPFIDRVGLIPVLDLMDHMSSFDAERFAGYLAEHSNYTNHPWFHQDVVNKRDDHHHHLHSYMQDLHSSYYQHLPAQQRDTFNQLMDAASQHTMTQYLSSVGYGPVFGLLEVLDGNHAYQVHQLIENALAAETATAPAKRAESSHHNYLSHYLSSLNAQYYEHLPEEARTIYHDLTKAVEAQALTAYIDTNGYGPIFFFLENLDPRHSDQAYKYITNALEAEQQTGAPVKRQSGDSHHHSSFSHYLSSLNAQYYEHLPEEARTIYHDLTKAVEAQALTAYIDTNGYGPIFFFLEHLDPRHADQAYTYISNALEAEKQSN